MWLNNVYLGGRGYEMIPKTMLSKVLDWKKLTQYPGHIYVTYGKGGFCSGSGATELSKPTLCIMTRCQAAMLNRQILFSPGSNKSLRDNDSDE